MRIQINYQVQLLIIHSKGEFEAKVMEGRIQLHNNNNALSLDSFCYSFLLLLLMPKKERKVKPLL